MTLHDLSQYYWLSQEIEALEAKMERLEAQADVSAQRLDGMPHGTERQSAVERLSVDRAELRTTLARLSVELMNERLRLEQYIASIDDSQTRLIMSLRFVDRLTWSEVAYMLGDEYTADAVKKVCYRYIKRH